MLINITEEEKKIIVEFLNRTELKGGEVPAFNAIITKLAKPVDEFYTKKETAPKVE